MNYLINQKKRLIPLIFCFLFLLIKSYSQPTVDWRNYSWVKHDYNSPNSQVTQRQSDYDWWFDHCTGYRAGNHIGYITCGVSKFRAKPAPAPLLTYDERGPLIQWEYRGGCAYIEAPFLKPNNNYDFNNFGNRESGELGLTFNQIGCINPNGTLRYLVPMNMGGEYTRVKQLQDGTFLTVGQTKATRKKNGLPLYYNPTLSNPTNQFNFNEIYTNGLNPVNKLHWDIMKFDGNNSTCLFNNIYGNYDFNGARNFSYDQNNSPITVNEKQLSYLSTGFLFDFVQEKNAIGNIAAVGFQENYSTQLNPAVSKAAIIKIDNNGNILSRRFIEGSLSDDRVSQARAIEFVNIRGNDYYIAAVTKSIASGQGAAEVDIYRIPTNFNNSTPMTLIKNFQANPNSGGGCTVWSMVEKDNMLYVLLITNTSWVWWSGDNFGELYLKVIDLNTNRVTVDEKITDVYAFDLKARITELSNGNFGVVSSVKKQNWDDLCPNVAIPNYLSPTNDGSLINTRFWNTDTYVAEINSYGQKMWENTYDVDSPFDCEDFPNSPNDRGGNPKRQECMYGISEAPDRSIVVSGNSSDNYDDAYMIKLNSNCSNSPDCHCHRSPSFNISVGQNNYDIADAQTISVSGTLAPVNMFYDGLCINTSNCTTNINQIEWNVYRKVIGFLNPNESHVLSGVTQNITFQANLFGFFPFLRRPVIYRIEIKHTCACNDCGTINLFLRS